MKKIIINTIIISLLAVSSVFASNNTDSTTTSNNNKEITASVSTTSTAVVTINDMNGKVVYTETFTVDTENGANVKLNPSSKLTKGLYIVTVVMDNEKMPQKLVVE